MSEYKRLTKKDKYGHWYTETKIYDRFMWSEDGKVWERDLTHCAFDGEAIDRLAELEDKIEDGTLIELPCKVGDIVYEVIKGLPIQEWEIISIDWSRTYGKNYVMWGKRKRDLAHWKFWREDFGKTLFLTKAEAEARLKELQEKQK